MIHKLGLYIDHASPIHSFPLSPNVAAGKLGPVGTFNFSNSADSPYVFSFVERLILDLTSSMVDPKEVSTCEASQGDCSD